MPATGSMEGAHQGEAPDGLWKKKTSEIIGPVASDSEEFSSHPRVSELRSLLVACFAAEIVVDGH
jgi:hypothetical protein